MAGIRFPARVNDFSLLHIVEISSGAHPASYSMGTELFSRKKISRALKLTAHLHLVPRSRMVELYLHSLYFFMA
jgi:hypothetical protein